MKNSTLSALTVLFIPSLAHGAIDYLDATVSNTTLADGTAMNLVASAPANPQDYTSSSAEDTADNHWHIRTGFANAGSVWNSTAGSTPFANNCPMLRSTVSGLIPGKLYNVYAYFWVGGYAATGTGGGPPTANNEFDIRAGLTAQALGTFTYNTAGVVNMETRAADFSATVLTTEGNRRLFQCKAGTQVADSSGQIQVYVDDNPGNDDRTWYDGVGTELSTDAIWDGGGSNGLWSTAANWAGDSAPVGSQNLYFGSNPGIDSVNDLPADTAFTGITFNPGADIFELTGNRLTLSGNIVNSSSQPQGISLPLLLDADRTVSGSLYLSGAISGPFGLIKSGAAFLELSGANAYTGPLTVQRGAVSLVNNQSAANGGLIIGPTSGNATTVTLQTDATAAVAPGKQVAIGNITAAGTASQIFVVSGTMANAGTLQLGRVAELNINNGGHWTQSGDAVAQGVGGYSNDLNVNDGGTFEHTAATTFKLNGAPANSGQSRLKIADTGVFVTGTGFEQTITPTTGYGRVTLQSGGTLRLSADVPQLTLGVRMQLVTAGTVDTAGFSTAISAAVSGAGALTKAGAGTLTLNAAPTYTGDTAVTGGTLALDLPGLADESAVTLGTGTTLHLGFTGSDTVGSLYLGSDPVPVEEGTYGRIGSIAALGADHETSLITGDGLLVVPPAGGFATWAGGLELSGDPEDDFDGDGLEDAVEYVLGSDPKASSPAWPSTMTAVGSDLVFTFTRDDESETPDVTTVIQTGTTLDAWPQTLTVGADDASSSAGVTVAENGSAPDLITVTIPKGGEPKTFARLSVTVAE